MALLRQRGIIVSDTGSGKTCIAAAITSCFKGRNIVMMVPTIDLMRQTYKDFVEYGLESVGMVGDQIYCPGRILVGTYNSLVSNPEFAHRAEVIIVDECQHLCDDGMIEKFIAASSARVVIGLTATLPPEKEKQLQIQAWTGGILYRVPVEDLKKAGMQAEVDMYLITCDRADRMLSGLSYKDKRKYGIVFNPFRNKEIVRATKLFNAKNESVLIIIKEIPHGDKLKKVMDKSGVKSVFIYGKTDGDTREKVKDVLKNKSQLCVIASMIWKEGVNIPSLDCVINAQGGKSEIQTRQVGGRGLRKTDEKTILKMVDFIDTTERNLAEHSAFRIATYVSKGWLGKKL